MAISDSRLFLLSWSWASTGHADLQVQPRQFVYQTFAFSSACELPSSPLRSQTTIPHTSSFVFSWRWCLMGRSEPPLSLPLLHLLLEIRKVVCACVSSSTFPTQRVQIVHLGLLHCMCGQVPLQWGCNCVHLVTVVLQPAGQKGGVVWGFLTAWVYTLVRLVPGVDLGVLLEVRELAGGFPTEITTIGLGPWVDTDVLAWLGAIGKGLGRGWALVGLGPSVWLGVDLHLWPE